MILFSILELFVLFILSRLVTNELSILFYRLTKSTRATVWLLAILFLPGTLIHELSHALMAALLFVPVGQMELMPRLSGESLKLGSVQVGKTDIVRNFLIGVGPFLVGLTIIIGILFFAFSNNFLGFNILSVAVLYSLFAISNTMFSSKKDMEGVVELIILILIFALGFYIAGVKIPAAFIKFLTVGNFSVFIKTSALFLILPLIIDMAVIVFAKIIVRR